MKNWLHIMYILLFGYEASAKVVIFTYAYNRPDFIELQYKTFQKFLEDEHELVVFSDAISDEIHGQIQAMCNNYDLRCIRVPQDIHNKPYLARPKDGPFSPYNDASVRNCNVVQYSLNEYGFDHNDILVLADSDMFLVKRLNIRNYMKGFQMAGEIIPCALGNPPHICKIDHPKVKPFRYLWIGLVFLDLPNMPRKKTINFNCGRVFGNVVVDSGGWTAYYLKRNKSIRVKGFKRDVMENLICDGCKISSKPAPACNHNTDTLRRSGLEDLLIAMCQGMPLVGSYLSPYGRPCEILMNGTFLHYRAGTNYQNFSTEYHQQKTRLFENFFSELLGK